MIRFLLQPSLIHGVGVFTLDEIPSDTLLPLFAADELLTTRTDELGERFGFWNPSRGGYDCPADLHRLSIGWYLNHSDEPNTRYVTAEDAYYSSRRILVGEEILISYSSETSSRECLQ